MVRPRPINPIEQNKSLKKENIWMKIECFFYVIVIIYLGVLMYNNNKNFHKFEGEANQKIIELSQDHPPIQENVVEYEGLNETQINQTKKLVEELGLLYTTYSKKIVFTNDTKKYCGSCHGVNIDAVAYVKVYEDFNITRETLCHELLHNIVHRPTSQEPYFDFMHAIVYDLGERNVCYSHNGDNYLAILYKAKNQGVNISILK